MIVLINSVDENGSPDSYLATIPAGMDISTGMDMARKVVEAAARAVAREDYDHMIHALDAGFQEIGWETPSWVGLGVDWRTALEVAYEEIEDEEGKAVEFRLDIFNELFEHAVNSGVVGEDLEPLIELFNSYEGEVDDLLSDLCAHAEESGMEDHLILLESVIISYEREQEEQEAENGCN